MARDARSESRGRHSRVWLFVSPDAVPESWRDRAEHVALIPLAPGEIGGILRGEGAVRGLSPQDEQLVRLLADGMTAREIARELAVSPRSVTRRLARLRARLGAAQNAELISMLSRAGF